MFKPVFFRAALGLTLTLGLSAAAQAHVTLEQPQATAGAAYKAVFKVGHACGEGQSTNAITVRVPEGFRGAQPVPKAGWTLSVQRAALAQPYEAHGHLVKDDVVEVRWQAQGPANALPGAYYDEFVLRGTPAGPAGPLWFKVLQGCDGGQSDWAEVPASGRSTRGLKAPAALLEVVAPAPVAAPSTPAAPAAHVH